MKTFTYTEAKDILNELGRFTISSWEHYGLIVIDTESGEFAIGTDSEADEAWEQSLDSYLEECIYPESPKSMINYFDGEAWKRDVRFDGRGHNLSSYYGDEWEMPHSDLVAFRIN